MSSWQIFFQRLINEWKFQISVFRTILDWTVIVYIVLPIVVIFSFIYCSWWIEIPDWSILLPNGIFFFIFYLFSLTGQVRTYVQDADQLFLLKHNNIFLILKKIA